MRRPRVGDKVSLARATGRSIPAGVVFRAKRCQSSMVRLSPSLPTPHARAVGELKMNPTRPNNPNEGPALATAGGDLPRALAELAAPAYVIDRDGRLRWLNSAFF